MKLGETVAYYLERTDNLNTRRTYGRILSPFARDFGPERELDDISVQDLDAWDRRMTDSGLATATVMSRRKAMRVFWNWTVKRELVSESPARFITVKKRRVPLVTKAIPREVLADMLSAVRHKREEFVAIRDTAILGLLTTYGARAGDVARLRQHFVNLKEAWIVLHVKGDKEIRLPLPPETAQVLSRWLTVRQTIVPTSPHDFVFVALRRDYPPLTSESISTMIKRLSKDVCGTAYGPHSIRHWRGQDLADHQTPPPLARDILGHSDVRITLDHYYNQDYERAKQLLESSEMGRSLGEAGKKNRRAKIVKVNFDRLTG